jgi:RNA polymerase sigma-70 factor (ECF subfamily)
MSQTTTQIQHWIERLQAGDRAARNELLKCACDRLVRLTRKMLKGYPSVSPWEEANDVLQSATLRLCRALDAVTPQTPREFFGLAAVQIRRQLLDLARHYTGGRGARAQRAGAEGDSASESEVVEEPPDTTNEPGKLASWSEFHQQVDALPAEEREVFDLLWYQDLSQDEAAAILNVSERTIRRRWQTARLRLHQLLTGEAIEI